MVDPNTNADEPRLVLTGSGSSARVVLAEVDAPGSLHYLLEAEGFQVVGCAGDDEELGRVLGQHVRPDVIVLDADIVVTASLVARQFAPDAHLIAIWPDDVQPPPGGERVSPRMVYEELGPAIRRHMDRRSVAVPMIALPDEGAAAVASVAVGAGLASAGGSASSGLFSRAASRMSVLSVTLIMAIVFTMGVSFALGGFRSSPPLGPPRLDVPGSSSDGVVTGTSDPLTSRAPAGGTTGPSGNKPSKHGGAGHSDASGFLGGVVTTGTGDGGNTPPDQTGGQGTGQTGQGGGQTDQGGGQSGGQGDQGGGQGDQGGGQGDQGGGQSGGQGDQGGGHGGGPGDHGGGPGDHGGGSGQQGGDGQGDQGGDGQGEDDQGGQGDQDGDDQGEDEQGGNSHGSHGPNGDSHDVHGDGHGAQGDQQGQGAQGN